MKNKALLKYLAPAVALGVFTFLMMAYGSAYTPPKPSKQRIVCYQFKAGTSADVIKQHMADYKALKNKLHYVAEYSAGSVLDEEEVNAEYEMVHRLTFRTEDDVQRFKNSAEYKEFVKTHESNWEKVLVINADIK
jgi:multidrug efflux pump subunit AcrB